MCAARAYSTCVPIDFESRARPLVMGVLNVTPDSFSDGGRYVD
ncbi:MAG: dihydropteroate synthase, partial [Actinobacteria bacterium]|nr:dihydropteroate synthase [Actinomycetota bacterium]